MVTIPLKIKYFLIIIITFCIIYWFQMVDDKKICKKRTNNYDKIKLPLLVSTIVGLVLLLKNDYLPNIYITSNSTETSILERPIVRAIERAIERPTEITNNYSNLDIYTGLPEW
jgi:uncharacterized membrane protein